MVPRRVGGTTSRWHVSRVVGLNCSGCIAWLFVPGFEQVAGHGNQLPAPASHSGEGARGNFRELAVSAQIHITPP